MHGRPLPTHREAIDLSQSQPAPGWYPDPAGSAGVRWWDGAGWTPHVAIPEQDEDASAGTTSPAAGGNVIELAPTFHDMVRVERPVLADDGQLHPRGKDVVFAGSLRGAVPAPDERRLLDPDELLGLQGMQALGALVATLFAWWLGVRGIMHPSGSLAHGAVTGIALSVGVGLPVSLRTALGIQRRSTYWWHWCASRGFEPGPTTGSASILPAGLDRSPLLGSTSERVVELAATRRLGGTRRAVVGLLLRLTGPPGAQLQERPEAHAVTFAVMPIPELAAVRWSGLSVRADHAARRPMALRAMLGSLLPARGPHSHAHLAIVPTQAPQLAAQLVDERLERYLQQHPMDVDVVGDLLVVTRDRAFDTAEALDDLCRDALLLHELLVAEHELPVEQPTDVAMPPEDEPIVDMTREGWGGGDAQYYEAA